MTTNKDKNNSKETNTTDESKGSLQIYSYQPKKEDEDTKPIKKSSKILDSTKSK